MGHRFIAKISTFVSPEDARAFVDGYNQNARGCHSAQIHDEADDRLPMVYMLEHDTEAEAASARHAESGSQNDDV